jgi:hypothetical protein
MIDLHGTHQIQQVPFRGQRLKVTFGDAEGSMQALLPASGLALIYSTFPLPRPSSVTVSRVEDLQGLISTRKSQGEQLVSLVAEKMIHCLRSLIGRSGIRFRHISPGWTVVLRLV